MGKHTDIKQAIPELDLFKVPYLEGKKDSFEDVMDAVLASIRSIVLAGLTPEAFKIALITTRALIDEVLQDNDTTQNNVR